MRPFIREVLAWVVFLPLAGLAFVLVILLFTGYLGR